MNKLFFSILVLASFSGAIASEITVSVASSLTEAVNEIALAYGRIHPGDNIRLHFAGSGTLRGQIERGAPVDLFLSASMRHIELLERKGLVVEGSRVDFAGNSLCLIEPRDNQRVSITKVDELKSKKVTRIAIGAPKSVPVGQYAAESLSSLNLWESVQSKLIYGNNVRQVLDYVSRGEVDFGIVYKTDAKLRKNTVTIVKSFASSTHSSIIYPAVVIKGSKNIKIAKQFSLFLKSEAARGILVKHGFTVQ